MTFWNRRTQKLVGIMGIGFASYVLLGLSITAIPLPSMLATNIVLTIAGIGAAYGLVVLSRY